LESRPARVVAVSASSEHGLEKSNRARIRLVVGLGVAGDAHQGRTVQHRSRVARDPDQPNLRQVHLIHTELHDELRAEGFEVSPGMMGENVTTRGIDLLGLARGTQLEIGDSVVVEVTGLRNPCAQLESIGTGVMEATLERGDEGQLVRKAGIMAIVSMGGEIAPGDPIRVVPPPGPQLALEPV
jgi:MOSC domain-containing protein YiiM